MMVKAIGKDVKTTALAKKTKKTAEGVIITNKKLKITIDSLVKDLTKELMKEFAVDLKRNLAAMVVDMNRWRDIKLAKMIKTRATKKKFLQLEKSMNDLEKDYRLLDGRVNRLDNAVRSHFILPTSNLKRRNTVQLEMKELYNKTI
jgi:hypothetical protein